MDYESAYLRASRNPEDSILMLSTPAAPGISRYQPYRPVHHRGSSELSASRTSWTVPPVGLQESLPPAPVANGGVTHIGSSILGSRAVLDAPYQESVAWENSTQFPPTSVEGPKPEDQANVYVAPERNLPRETRKYFRTARHISEPWKAGGWARFPWWGLGALVMVVLLTGVSAGILLASDGMSLDDWRVGKDNAQPHVYLSVFEMVMNFLILFAIADGAVIRFWRQLLHGTTLSALHDTYESAHLWPATKRIVRLRFNTVATACLCGVLSFLRGPLLQRASTVQENSISSTSGLFNLRIAPYPIPEYFRTNEIDPRKQNGLTMEFFAAVRDTSSDSALRFDQPPECGDYCKAQVKGFAFKPDCASTSREFDLSSLPEECRKCSTPQCISDCEALLNNELNAQFFSVRFRQEEDVLRVTTVFKDKGSCSGEVQVHTCAFTQTTAEYPIIMANSTIDRKPGEPNTRLYDEAIPLHPLLMEKYWPLAFESLFPPVSVNVTPAQDFSQLSYIKCINPMANETDTEKTSALCSNGTTSQPSLLARDPSILYSTPSSGPSDTDALCDLTWRDPMPDIIDKMQSLAFRITVDMANNNGSIFTPTFTGDALVSLRSNWSQQVSVSGWRSQAIFKTNPILVALGVFLSLLGVAAAIPLYSGFWELGRKFSLNPLEVARAFGAPLMEGLDGNATPDTVAVERGGMAVRYGALERYGNGKTLRIEETARATVRTPWQGEIFG